MIPQRRTPRPVLIRRYCVNRQATLGRYFLVAAVAYFGVQYILSARFPGGLPPIPPWTPGGAIGAYLVGVCLLALSVGLLLDRYAALSAAVFGALFLFCVFALHTWKLSDVIHRGTDRTRALEPMALAGAAFVLAELLSADHSAPFSRAVMQGLALFGRVLFGFTLVVFGAQHFMYAEYIATLIPSWIPGHLLFTYLSGVGMISAGVALLINVCARLASILLGLMFLFWVLFLHAPRVAGSLRNGNEWASMMVALAMSGSAFVFAGWASPSRQASTKA